MIKQAQVFISCGQSHQTDEMATATAIAARLRDDGFDPYIAVMEQSLKGIRENIFRQLAISEYFVFVDFKREQLGAGPECRGSLFSHQELALASYLDLPVLFLQEKGIRRLDGLAAFLQGNATEFTDRSLLPNVVADLVRQKKWDPDWSNRILLERDPTEFDDSTVLVNGKSAGTSRFFHVRVKNLHRESAARNCYVYLERIYDIVRSRDLEIATVEIKWAGYPYPNAIVAPRSSRLVDAFYVDLTQPLVANFNAFVDSTRYAPRMEIPGCYQITLAVMSENFPTARATFDVLLDRSLDKTRCVASSR